MNVTKRNGEIVPYDIEKVRNVIRWAAEGLDVSPLELESKIDIVLKDEMDTRDIQKNLITHAATLTSLENPDWKYVAGRLLIMSLWKQLGKNPKDKANNYVNFVYDMVASRKYDDKLIVNYSEEELHDAGSYIDPDRDLDFDYAGAIKLKRSYLIEGESPQEAFMSMSLLLAIPERKENRLKYAKQFYDAISKRKLSLATPFLGNLRIPDGNVSSCFVIGMDDSLESITDTWANVSQISKNGGGVGINMSRIRSEGATIKNVKGASGGIVPSIKVLNDIAVYINQLGRRAGAFTISIDIWHRDLEAFLELQTENGDLRTKAFDIQPQLVVPDLFMERDQEDSMWTLFDPHEVKTVMGFDLAEAWGDDFRDKYIACENAFEEGRLVLVDEIPARTIMKQIISNYIETGLPYLAFKDTINEVNPNKHEGYIPSVNLCVHPDTKILTKKGNISIGDLENKLVTLWNGKQWSDTVVVKTGENQEMLEIEFSDTSSVKCTHYHKFYIMDGYRKTKEVRANELKIGDKLIKFNLPTDSCVVGNKTLPDAYTQGFFSGDGSYNNESPTISLYGEKIDLKEALKYKSEGKFEEQANRIRVTLYKNEILGKSFIPFGEYTLQTKVDWLAGLIDSDGHNQNDNIVISSNNTDFIKNVKLFLQEIGVHSSISITYDEGYRNMPNGKGGKSDYFCKAVYRLIISKQGMNTLMDHNMETYRVHTSYVKVTRDTRKYITVTNITKSDASDTFCFNEPLEHKGVFNGQLLGNCVESYSNVIPGEETHTCNLDSINLANIDGDDDLRHVAGLAVRVLDNAIDLTTPPIESSKFHNMKYRTIGVGSMGLADWLAKQFSGYDAGYDKIADLYEKIALYTIDASITLAEERGAFMAYEGSMWDTGERISVYKTRAQYKDDWNALAMRLMKHGIRNSQITAIAPNTSTSLVQGCTASIWPVYSKFYFDNNSSGAVPIVPPYIKDGFWSYKEYKHMDSMKMNDIVSIVQHFTDTGISYEPMFDLNKEGLDAKYIYDFIHDAWEKQIKTLYYVRLIQKDSSMRGKEECESCSG